MDRKSMWKWGLLAVMTAASLWLVIPPGEKIVLGLDLQGGSSFVVAIDEEAVREDIKRKNVDLEEEKLEKLIKDALKDAKERALEVIRNRIDQLGIREPTIYPEKASGRIIIQLPGAKKEQREEALTAIKRVAFLAFHLVHEDNERLVEKLYEQEIAPPGYKIIDVEGIPYYKRIESEAVESAPTGRKGFGRDLAPSGYAFYLHRRFLEKEDIVLHRALCVKELPDMTGATLRDARGDFSPMGQRYVSLEFGGKGRVRFREITNDYQPGGRRNKSTTEGRRLAVVLDSMVYSAPAVRTRIPNGKAIIEGHFPGNEADRLALVLRSGSLPAPVKIVESRIVDPSLGRDSINSGIRSIIYGGIGVVVFMIVYYLISGIIADIALVLDLVLLPLGMVVAAGFLGTLLGTQGGTDNAFALPVLTLPGIAGILLTIGIAVDANVLIFERMREEFRTGRSLWSAIQAGYDRAFVTIMDANITTLLTGIILFVFGSGPIRGFAVTLCGGILVSMFTALVVTKMIFGAIAPRIKQTTLRMLSFIKDTSIDFVGKRKIAASASLLLIVLTWGLMGWRGSQDVASVLGVDFVSGSSVTFSFTEKQPVDEVRDALAQGGITGAQIQYQAEMDGQNEYLHVKAAFGSAGKIKEVLPKALPAAGLVDIAEDEVGSQVSTELKARAIKAIIIALLGIVVYISWRFELGFAVGAIVALAHDVLITVGVYSLCGRQLSLPIVAALLTIVGYSVNDTIVVFDRIREDLRLVRNKSFKEICNLSINQTLSRTLLTSLTTLITVVMLLVFGGGAINDFALALFIGVLVGTYSSIFVATPVVLAWYRDRKPEFSRKAPKTK